MDTMSESTVRAYARASRIITDAIYASDASLLRRCQVYLAVRYCVTRPAKGLSTLVAIAVAAHALSAPTARLADDVMASIDPDEQDLSLQDAHSKTIWRIAYYKHSDLSLEAQFLSGLSAEEPERPSLTATPDDPPRESDTRNQTQPKERPDTSEHEDESPDSDPKVNEGDSPNTTKIALAKEPSAAEVLGLPNEEVETVKPFYDDDEGEDFYGEFADFDPSEFDDAYGEPRTHDEYMEQITYTYSVFEDNTLRAETFAG